MSLRRLVGYRRRRLLLFAPGDVCLFEMRGGLVTAIFPDGSTLAVEGLTLERLYQRLNARQFRCISRSTIVNLDRITEIERVRRGQNVVLRCYFGDALEVTTSRAGAQRLRAALGLPVVQESQAQVANGAAVTLATPTEATR